MRAGRRWLAAAALLAAACRSAPHPAPAAPAPSRVAARPEPAPPAPAPAPDTVSHATVTRELERIFGDSATLDSARMDEPRWDIDVTSYETHARVEYFIGRFRGASRESFARQLGRGGRYDALIRARLRKAGLPEDLTYLALIESGYDPHAYSRAAAVGIWQLMTTTAKGVGLRVDWWVDERRDPIRSTDGAIRFLGWLNEQFGSPYLAAAAYNGGPGRISRGLSRYANSLDGAEGDDAFFALAETDYLRAETRDYVPKLIAAAIVAKDPRRFGIPVSYDAPFEYDSVRAGPATALGAVARAAGVPIPVVGELNSHLLRGVTPPRDSSWVRIPTGRALGFAERYAALSAEDRDAFRRLETRKNETRATLARRAGITVRQLGWYNPELKASKRGKLVAGQRVLVPTALTLATALDIPDPAIERYGSSTARKRGEPVLHVVRRGESLGGIAKKYGTSVAALKRMNHLRKSVIFPGQEIMVREGSGSSRSRSASRSTSSGTRRVASSQRESSAKPSSSRRVSLSTAARMDSGRKTANGAARTHVVKRGESLTSIARKYGTTVAAIKELNGLERDAIQAGKRLKVGG